jgi:RNA polymerase sigma factor for flagellar operon FliA
MTSCEVRNQLVMEHVDFVKTLARGLSHRLPPQIECAELVSVGVIGLIDAANRYEPDRGVPFTAFARRRVHGAMLDSLRELDCATRSDRRGSRAIAAATAQLWHELQREPSASEIAGRLGMSEDDYDGLAARLRHAEALLDAADDDGDTVVAASTEGPDARLERIEQEKWLAAAVAKLPERERRVLTLSYQRGLPLAKVGKSLGVSESRASQLRAQAITRLRALLVSAPAAESISPDQQGSRWPRH